MANLNKSMKRIRMRDNQGPHSSVSLWFPVVWPMRVVVLQFLYQLPARVALFMTR